MQLLKWVTALASTSILWGQAIAVPLQVGEGGEVELEKREDTSLPLDVILVNEPNPERTKYFHEAGNRGALRHYDGRYFSGLKSDSERKDTLHHMIRAYLRFFQQKGLETWIAHGTLLGWWWNGQILPWDTDIDTQVSGETLDFLGKNLNQTTHHYKQDGVDRTYFLDVNPWSSRRDKGDGMNVIDARWIDMRNGFYIDITGLSETRPENPGWISCKNDHSYQTKDLYPMRESTYEGVPAKIPYAYEQVLTSEYAKAALTRTQYAGHVWNEQSKLWIQRFDISPHQPKEPVNSKRRR